jgi:homoserine O-acetyltransferase
LKPAARCSSPAKEGTVRITENGPFLLESGETLTHVDVHFAMYGEANAACDNVVLVCHALSGSATVHDWWPDLLNMLDPTRNCILCTNVIGSCYGTTGPLSTDPATGEPYNSNFPRVSIRDMVRAEALVADQLGIKRFKGVIGGSIGGMQALQWAIDYPERIEACVAIGACPLGAMGIGLNHLQRQIIALDPLWNGGQYSPEAPPIDGLAIARALAVCSYKSAALFDQRHDRKPNRSGPAPWEGRDGRFDIEGYLDHQGEIFLHRFDANSYIAMTYAMDGFDPARDYGDANAAWSRVKARVLLVGISSDWLFPAADIRRMGDAMKAAGVNVTYSEIESHHGHDSFLAEPHQLLPVTSAFLKI